MKKRIIAAIASTSAVLACAFAFSSCAGVGLTSYNNPNHLIVEDLFGGGYHRDDDSQGWSYEWSNETSGYRLVGAENNSGYVEIPSYYEGEPVTEIGDNVFSANESLYTISIPYTIKRIGAGAFKGCSSLYSVYFSTNKLESVGEGAFENCASLSSISIPSSVTSIGRYAFYGCDGLTSITLPFVGASKDGVEDTHFGYVFGADSYTGNYYFVPSSLTTVSISGGDMIDAYAFKGCEHVQSVSIPSSVTSIGEHAFEECYSLSSVSFYSYGSLASIGDYAFCDCSSLEAISIPYYVGTIGDNAFAYCTNLESLYFYGSDYLTAIGAGAFAYCSSLESVSIPYYVETIGDSAFYNCDNLSSVSFSLYGNLERIGSYAFYDCDSLTSVSIPYYVTHIGQYAFAYCDDLYSVYFYDTSTWYRTYYSDDWEDRYGGTSMSVSSSYTNADYFTSSYEGYYWYKK